MPLVAAHIATQCGGCEQRPLVVTQARHHGGHSYHIRHAWLGVYIAPAWLVVTQARHIGKGPIPATARAPGRGRWPRGEHAAAAFLSAVPAQHHCDELPTQRGAAAPLPPPPCLRPLASTSAEHVCVKLSFARTTTTATISVCSHHSSWVIYPPRLLLPFTMRISSPVLHDHLSAGRHLA